jgi:hypothetical protein
MTIYRITMDSPDSPYFVDAETMDEAIEELKASLGLEELSGDVDEMS